jgi:hypothetical protein
MKRYELEHIIRAASGITNQSDIVVVGSQAILAQFPNAHPGLLVSMEADVFPLHRPELSIQIEGAIGEHSMFHETHGYYAHGVGEDTAVLPKGWKQRLIPVRNSNTNNATGWGLEVHDLAASKLVAGREKDLEFVGLLLREMMIAIQTMKERIATLPEERQSNARQRFERLCSFDKTFPPTKGRDIKLN